MTLEGKKIVVLLEKDFQDAEALYPYYRMKEAGADVVLAASEKIQYFGKYGYPLTATKTFDELQARDFHAVIIPGGWAPDFMRRSPALLKFVKQMNDDGKVIAAICHAGWVLTSAGVLKGRKVTCFTAIRDDVVNAGGIYEDKEVVVDKNLVTSRKPDDLPAFCREVIRLLEKQV